MGKAFRKQNDRLESRRAKEAADMQGKSQSVRESRKRPGSMNPKKGSAVRNKGR